MIKEELKRLIVEANTPEQYETLANRLISTSVPWFFTSNYGEDAIAKYSEFKWYMSSKFRISLIKKALNISTQRDETPRFLNNYMRLVIFIGAPMTCLMFTAFAETKKIHFCSMVSYNSCCLLFDQVERN